AMEAHAIGFSRPAWYGSEFGQLGAAGVEPVNAQHGGQRIVTIAGDHDHPGGPHVHQVDVVEPPASREAAGLAVQAIDVEPGLLVGGDDQAGGRIGRVAPDGRIVGGVLCRRADRLGFDRSGNRDRRQAARGRGAGAEGQRQGSGERCGGEAAHQNAYLPTSWNTGPAFSASSSYSSKSRSSWSAMVSNLLNTSRFLELSRLEPTARRVKLSPKRFSTNTSRSAP